MTLTTDASDFHKIFDQIKSGMNSGDITGVFIVTVSTSGKMDCKLTAAQLGQNKRLIFAVTQALAELEMKNFDKKGLT